MKKDWKSEKMRIDWKSGKVENSLNEWERWVNIERVGKMIKYWKGEKDEKSLKESEKLE